MANLERQTQEASTRYRNLRHEQFISAESLRKDPQSAGKSLWANDALLEDVARRQGQTQQPGDWADAQVTKQLMGMGVDRYEVGILKDKRMTLTEMDTNRVIYESSNLRKLNVGGAEIHIRPKETSGYSLSLVDDVSLETIVRMKQEGFTPAAVVRTSAGNHQAWMRHGEALDRETNSAAGKALAERFGADIGGTPAGHMGRLAGTTNQKESRQENGKAPWVVVVEAPGVVYAAAPELIGKVRQELAAVQRYEPRVNQERRQDTDLKTIDDFRRDSRYGGDGNRVDFAYAMYARDHGVSRVEVAQQIRTRDLKAKSPNYVDYTIQRAEAKVGGHGRGM